MSAVLFTEEKMMDKLTWVYDFITKDLYAPYVVDKDENYYDDLKRKYQLLLKKLKRQMQIKKALKYYRNILIKLKKQLEHIIMGKYLGPTILLRILLRNAVRTLLR